MEFLNNYMAEIALGGSGALGGLIITLLKAFAKRLRKIEEKLIEMDKKIDINTALDKERQGKR